MIMTSTNRQSNRNNDIWSNEFWLNVGVGSMDWWTPSSEIISLVASLPKVDLLLLLCNAVFPFIFPRYSFACPPEVFNTLFVNFISSEESSTQNNKMFTKSRNLFVVVRLFRNSPFTNSFVTSDVLKTFVPHICIRVIGQGWFCHLFSGCWMFEILKL